MIINIFIFYSHFTNSICIHNIIYTCIFADSFTFNTPGDHSLHFFEKIWNFRIYLITVSKSLLFEKCGILNFKMRISAYMPVVDDFEVVLKDTKLAILKSLQFICKSCQTSKSKIFRTVRLVRNVDHMFSTWFVYCTIWVNKKLKCHDQVLF